MDSVCVALFFVAFVLCSCSCSFRFLLSLLVALIVVLVVELVVVALMLLEVVVAVCVKDIDDVSGLGDMFIFVLLFDKGECNMELNGKAVEEGEGGKVVETIIGSVVK